MLLEEKIGALYSMFPILFSHVEEVYILYFLNEKPNQTKPIFLAYISISEHTWKDAFPHAVNSSSLTKVQLLLQEELMDLTVLMLQILLHQEINIMNKESHVIVTAVALTLAL